MTQWTADEQRAVKQALLGSWPGTITAWGREAFAAFIGELEARGLSADRVLFAIRTWPVGSDFPPSAPNLAAAAMRDPSKPTFDEAMVLIREALRAGNRPLIGDYANEAEMIRARGKLVHEAAAKVHPLVGSFLARCDLLRLADDIAEMYGDGEYAGARRKELSARWEAHCEAMDGRDVAALAAGERRGRLGRLDPLAALGAPRRELERASEGSE